MAAGTQWKLVPKLKPEHVEDHAGFLAALAETEREIAGIGVLARVFSMSRTRERAALISRRNLLQRKIAACYMRVGADLGPPRIGIDESATRWYRKFLSEDESAWPLPPDEMIEEAKGSPVWELCDKPPPFDLGMEWPEKPLPVPNVPGASAETVARMGGDLTAEGAIATGECIRKDILAHLRRTYPALAESPDAQVVRALQAALRPGGPPTGPSPQAAEAILHAMSAALWLEFWGRHGYAFTVGRTPA